MGNRSMALICFSMGFGIVCFIWAIAFTAMANDLRVKVTSQENYIHELERENTQMFMCCERK